MATPSDGYRGVVSTCQAATTTWGGMMALRFLLGVFEAAYGPGYAIQSDTDAVFVRLTTVVFRTFSASSI